MTELVVVYAYYVYVLLHIVCLEVLERDYGYHILLTKDWYIPPI